MLVQVTDSAAMYTWTRCQAADSGTMCVTSVREGLFVLIGPLPALDVVGGELSEQ